MKISLLVCTLNEQKSIQERLINLCAMYVPENISFSIHVLDNGSTDETCALAKKFSDQHGAQIHVHVLGAIGKCAALFWAFEHFNSDYYLLTDANTIFCRDVLKIFASSFAEHPNSGVFIGNTRSVTSSENGANFLSQMNVKLPSRMRLEERYGIFTGANGACYGVSCNAVKGIWKFPAVRNDDFIISVYAVSRSSACYMTDAKAYEVENLSYWQLFFQKYRDALGHYQAIRWIQRSCGHTTKGQWAVFFRLIYWLFPGVVVAISVIQFGPIAIGFIILLSQFISTIRRSTLRLLALYIGFVVGLIRPPPVSWITNR